MKELQSSPDGGSSPLSLLSTFARSGESRTQRAMSAALTAGAVFQLARGWQQKISRDVTHAEVLEVVKRNLNFPAMAVVELEQVL